MITTMQAQGVEEAWTRSDFCDSFVVLQRARRTAPPPSGATTQIFDRSPLCTLALARYLNQPATPLLAEEVARVTGERVYQPTVFLVRPLGFIEPTAARRISYADTLAFDAVHQAVNRDRGVTIVDVPPAAATDRA